MMLLLGCGGEKQHKQFTCNGKLKLVQVTNIDVEKEKYYIIIF